MKHCSVKSCFPPYLGPHNAIFLFFFKKNSSSCQVFVKKGNRADLNRKTDTFSSSCITLKLMTLFVLNVN